MSNAPPLAPSMRSASASTASSSGGRSTQAPTGAAFSRLRSESGFQFDICRSTRSTAANSAAASASVRQVSGAKNTAA